MKTENNQRENIHFAPEIANDRSNCKNMEKQFTNWINWKDRAEIADNKYPGVYAIAITKKDLTGTVFSWKSCIVYVGMTNSKGGLKKRLYQFDYTIRGGYGHGGALRYRFKHPDYSTQVPKLYVAVRPFKCQLTSEMPKDLRVMGEVAKFEYECFAVFVEAYGQLPEFNDKKRSPKK